MSTFSDVKEQLTIAQVKDMLNLQWTLKNNQYRTRCPVHGGDDRALVVTPGAGYACHTLRLQGKPSREWGGDLIALYAHVKGGTQTDACKAIAEHFGIGALPRSSTAPSTVRKVAAQPSDDAERLQKVAASLLPEHEEVQNLDISPETAKAWGIGFKPSGTMVQRVLFPIRNQSGELRGYAGLSQTKQPQWMLPSNLDPTAFIFGADRIEEGEVRIASSPLDVVLLQQFGGGQAVAFLTETASTIQAEMFAALLSTTKCEWVP